MTFLCICHCFHIWRIPIQSRTGIYALGEFWLQRYKEISIFQNLLRFFDSHHKNPTFGRFGRYIKGRNNYLGVIYEPLHALFCRLVCVHPPGWPKVVYEQYKTHQGWLATGRTTIHLHLLAILATTLQN